MRVDNPGVDRALAVATSRETGAALAVTGALVALLFAYVSRTGARVVSVRHALLPFVWIGVSVWLVLWLRAYGPEAGRSWAAWLVGAGYFLLLGVVGSTFGLAGEATGVRVVWATPGWGPMAVYAGSLLRVVVVPFEVAGYLGLAYAVARAVAATSKSALAGTVALFGCVSCTLPLVAAVAGAFGASALAVSPAGFTYDVATAVFVLTAVLLAAGLTTTTPAVRDRR